MLGVSGFLRHLIYRTGLLYVLSSLTSSSLTRLERTGAQPVRHYRAAVGAGRSTAER